MRDVLRAAEAALPQLLADQPGWTGVYVDYHPPFVERLWRQWDEFRISLHRIHECGPGEALFHPHPWPQAVRVLTGGEYEMAIGFGTGEELPPVAMTVAVPEGFIYTMEHQDGWHSVRPIGRASYSLMVTGKPWNRPSPRSTKPLRELLPDERERLFAVFAGWYGGLARGRNG